MLVKIISLSFNPAYGGFSDVALQDFMKDKEIISVQDYFFVQNQLPYLTLIIQYLPLRQELNPDLKPLGKRSESWRETLSHADMGLFNLLRDWRAKRCKREGLPPYILFTNQQLAQIVKLRPQSVNELMKIEGIGKVKADKYGSEILDISKIDTGHLIHTETSPQNMEEKSDHPKNISS